MNEKQKKRFEKLLQEYEIEESEDGYDYKFETTYGVYRFDKPSFRPRDQVSALFGRFDEPKRVRRGNTGCNPHNGKRNFYMSSATSLLNYFESFLRNTCAKKRLNGDRYALKINDFIMVLKPGTTEKEAKELQNHIKELVVLKHDIKIEEKT